jgi:hypothetical protein
MLERDQHLRREIPLLGGQELGDRGVCGFQLLHGDLEVIAEGRGDEAPARPVAFDLRVLALPGAFPPCVGVDAAVGATELAGDVAGLLLAAYSQDDSARQQWQDAGPSRPSRTSPNQIRRGFPASALSPKTRIGVVDLSGVEVQLDLDTVQPSQSGRFGRGGHLKPPWSWRRTTTP